MYASLAEVRASPGVDPAVTDEQITAALAGAKERIDRFTSDTFEPAELTVRALLQGGTAPLPMRVQSVSAVALADVPSATPLAATAYAVRSSATRGDVDAVQLLGYGILSSALLDVTYEPVRLGSDLQDRAILVTGLFGWAETPEAVRDAAVLLAAAELPGDAVAGTVNAEGDASLGIAPTVPVRVRSTGGATAARTTGDSYVDSLLLPYRRRLLQVS